MFTVNLTDEAAGTQARIAVDQGFNLFEFTVPTTTGKRDVLWAAKHFDLGRERPSGSGIPILFPFPGRLARAQFAWQDRLWTLPSTDGRGNAIHGFVYDRPWRLIDQSTAHATGQFQGFLDFPAVKELWPSDFVITTTYRLQGTRLECHYRLSNPGVTPLPYGFGIHPYFRLPDQGPDRDRCLVRLPVTTEWELDALLATGRKTPAPVEYPAGVAFAKLHLDNVFSGLQFSADRCCCAIDDPATGRLAAIDFGTEFRELVVYNPPHRDAVCIEPYTCVPGAAHLNVPLSEIGWRTLDGGASTEIKLTIRVDSKI